LNVVEEETVYRRYGLIWLVIAAIISIISIFIFILTQDMRRMMVLLDWLTIVHAILLIIEIIAAVLVKRGFSKKKNKKAKVKVNRTGPAPTTA